MRYLITILFLYAYAANATNYYVKNSGSDGANGLSNGTAWQTLSKINSSSFSAGDSIFLNKGDTWIERILPPSSGTLASAIYIGSYGTGVKPLITSLQTQTGFTNVGSVWTATATNATKQLNTVLISGTLQAKARYPNTGYLNFTTYSGSPTITSITGTLTGTPNYTGADIVVRTTHWILDRSTITSQSSGTLNFSPGLTYNQPYFGGNGYFIQNTDLDVQGEWTYDSTSKVLKVYSTTSPTVQIATIDTLVWLRSKSYITFDGLSFTGANKAAFQLDTANHITIQNCTINNSGGLGISGIKSTRCIITKDSIQNSLSGAVYLRQVDPYTPTVNVCDSALVDSSYIKNTGYLAGMGMNNNGRYVGIFIIGAATTITNNRIDSSGYIGVQFAGANSLIKNNYVTNFCFVKDDGAGIYTVIGAYLPSSFSDGSIIRSNIISGSPGALAGTSGASQSGGIYLDDLTRFVTVDSNTISNTTTQSMFFNGANNITLRYNTLIDSLGHGLEMQGAISALSIKRNVFYNQSSPWNNIYFHATDFAQSVDSNYYLRPVLETGKLKMNATTYTLAAWTAATSYDTHSSETPTGITAALPLFVYNPTLRDSTISLSGTYKNAKGTSYTSSVTLHPYNSEILFKATADITAPLGNRIGYLIFN